MLVTADALDFLIALLPVIFLTHLAFRIGLLQGRSSSGVLLLIGSSLITFSFIFKIYFDIVFGGVDTFWLFVLTFGTAAGLICALAGTSNTYVFLASTRSDVRKAADSPAKFAGIMGAVFILILGSYFFSLRRPTYWFLGAICFLVSQVALFEIGILIGEFFHLIGRPRALGMMRLAKALASYYLVEPLLWWAAMRVFHNMDLSSTSRALVNLCGVFVSAFFAGVVVQYVRHFLPTNLRQVKTTYLDLLRIKVLRDLYIIGICIIAFVSLGLLAARAAYEDLRISTIENYAKSRLSVFRLAAAEARSNLQDIVLKLQKAEGATGPDVALTNLLKNDMYVDAVGIADDNMKVIFFNSNNTITSDDAVRSLWNTNDDRNGGDVEIGVYHDVGDPEFLISIKDYGKSQYRTVGGKNYHYTFSFVNLPKMVMNKMFDVSGTPILLLSSDSTVIYSNQKSEIGESLQKAISTSNEIEAIGSGPELGSTSGSGFKGYEILKGHNPEGIGEYFILIAVPIEFHGYHGILATLEPEDEISGLFRPTNSLLILSGLLIAGLFGGGIIVMSVAFRWSTRLEKEVQNKIHELRSSEDKYRRIVENPYIGSFIMVDGRVIFSNDRLAEILEIEVERLSGSDLSVFIESKDYIFIKSIFDSIIRGEKSGDKWQVAGTTASGRNINLSGYSSIINIGAKKGVQSLVVDSTVELREKEKLEQFERLESMATLAAGIAHDFNNILQVVLGSSQLLQHKLKDAGLRKYADNITNVAVRGSDLSKRLLTFSRQKGLEEKKSFDINEIILESLPLFEETFPRTIKIQTDLCKQPIFIEGDQSQIQQVIFNLAVNARDAMPHGGTLTIKTEIRSVNSTEAEVYQSEAGTYAYIVVKDDGEGIPVELMSKVFEPFFTTKPPGKGTGLGLSVVYGIVRSHNGFLKVYSEIKKGTVFNIYLPVIEPSAKAMAAPVKVKRIVARDGGKILFVDDESGIRETAQFLLEQAGYEVLTAKDGMSAIDIYKNEWKKIDLVVLDLNMPELSGREVLENFTIINPDVCVLISTGYITKEERTGLKGMVEVIEKPFNFDQLIEKVRSTMAHSEDNG